MYRDENGILWGGRTCPHCKCNTKKLKYQPKPKPELECLECKTKFVAKSNTQKFCSPVCTKIHSRKTLKTKKIKYLKTCPTCESEFETSTKSKIYCKPNHSVSSKIAQKNRKKVSEFKQPISKHFKKQIIDIYLKRPDGFHVDHIIPINHPEVCGLHVPWNMQYLPAAENIKKSNKFEPLTKLTNKKFRKKKLTSSIETN